MSHRFRGSVLPTLFLVLITGIATGQDQERGAKKRVTPLPAQASVAERGVQASLAIGNYYGLIIGNNAYRDPQKKWEPLSTPIDDAKTIAKILTQHYGFKRENVQLLTDATRGDILNAFKDLYQKVQNEDSVLIYYAGHGHLNTDTEEAYWIPVDAQGMEEANLIVHSELRTKLALLGKKALHTIMISDSCFSGALLGNMATRGERETFQNFDYYLRKVSTRKSVQIIAAGGREFVDDSYLRSGHSPFTYFLLQELQQNREPVMTASDLSHYLLRAVGNNSRQTPQAGPLRDAGDAGGEFIFVNHSAVKAQAEETAHASRKPSRSTPESGGARQSNENERADTDAVHPFDATSLPQSNSYTYQGRQITLPPESVFDVTGLVERADVIVTELGSPAVAVTLKDSAKPALHEFSRKNIGREAGMIFNAKLVSVAVIQSELGTRFQISGADLDEAKKLAAELSGKSLPDKNSQEQGWKSFFSRMLGGGS